ncbi:anthranilate synthase alpha subunit 2, chloroplastic-like [Henckelia pumila]|uniref:anthranilate synthase alpha subunit 2, chloroplastic-like n=1 Tax=Henckelia pumila TaxID=405737 RepID=UPI003C6E425E
MPFNLRNMMASIFTCTVNIHICQSISLHIHLAVPQKVLLLFEEFFRKSRSFSRHCLLSLMKYKASYDPFPVGSGAKAYVIHWVHLDRYSSVKEAYEDGIKRFEVLVSKMQDVDPPKLSPGRVDFRTHDIGLSLSKRNMMSEEYMKAALQAKEHIFAGDIFQIVLSQRFERRTFADPFEVYRALRVVNPSPYMAYLQARGCILVASSPEILARVKKRKIINRPLIGTARRGKSIHEDEMLEIKLLKDEKQCAEHRMLVDLGRNDVGKIPELGGDGPAHHGD